MMSEIQMLRQIANLAQIARDKQIHYFRSRALSLLDDCKRAERDLDDALREYLKWQRETAGQLEMFK